MCTRVTFHIKAPSNSGDIFIYIITACLVIVGSRVPIPNIYRQASRTTILTMLLSPALYIQLGPQKAVIIKYFSVHNVHLPLYGLFVVRHSASQSLVSAAFDCALWHKSPCKEHSWKVLVRNIRNKDEGVYLTPLYVTFILHKLA